MTSSYAEHRNCYRYVITCDSNIHKLLKNKSVSLSKLMIHNIMNVLNNPLNRSHYNVSFDEVEKFIRWTNKRNYQLDWRIFAYFCLFKSQNKNILGIETLKDLFVFSASQWTYFDKSHKNKIIIYSNLLFGFKFIAIKSESASQPRKLYIKESKMDVLEFQDKEKEIAFF
ncbi:hypothetical protein EZJ58_1024 [Sodalis ligni]|uniref:Uncharacterized protein n=1 Tax=Sodalis ligni TaxID=2697027 RepID=A0A4R1N6U6_9GAMM|nr:hypothetical protein EZJ58_1024 [Sodalis ligni]